MLHVGKSTPIHSRLVPVDFLKQGMLQHLCVIYNNGYKLISSLECTCGLFLSISATVFITARWNLCRMWLYPAAATHSYEQWKEKTPRAEQREWEWHSSHTYAAKHLEMSGYLQRNPFLHCKCVRKAVLSLLLPKVDLLYKSTFLLITNCTCKATIWHSEQESAESVGKDLSVGDLR